MKLAIHILTVISLYLTFALLVFVALNDGGAAEYLGLTEIDFTQALSFVVLAHCVKALFQAKFEDF